MAIAIRKETLNKITIGRPANGCDPNKRYAIGPDKEARPVYMIISAAIQSTMILYQHLNYLMIPPLYPDRNSCFAVLGKSRGVILNPADQVTVTTRLANLVESYPTKRGQL